MIKKQNQDWDYTDKEHLPEIQAIHSWLKVRYGKATKCENKLCKGKSKRFDWAKKTEWNYVRDRNAFIQLCKSCHRKYDLTTEKKVKAIDNLWWSKGAKNMPEGIKRKISATLKVKNKGKNNPNWKGGKYEGIFTR